MTRDSVRWLRVEGLAALGASVALYASVGGSWLVFALLFLAPDLSMLGYIGGRKAGATAYNLVHTYTAPLALVGAGLLLGASGLPQVALIWTAHIGFDRALGYGLKLPSGFHDTHLGTIGAAPSRGGATRGPSGAARDRDAAARHPR